VARGGPWAGNGHDPLVVAPQADFAAGAQPPSPAAAGAVHHIFIALDNVDYREFRDQLLRIAFP